MEKPRKIYIRAIIAFAFTLLLCATVTSIAIINKGNIEKITMEQLIIEKSINVNDTISRLLYKTQTLSALVIKNDGSTEDFNQIAATIVDDPAILNVLIAPNGVVSDVYPLNGNEAVIGLDFFAEGLGNKEAIMAKETGGLVFGGPFTLVQGGQALVGRLPVYLDDGNGGKRFWGLVSVTLKYPEVLDRTGLASLTAQGYCYEIWRLNPDDHQKQIIANSDDSGNHQTRYIEKGMQIQSAQWFFRIAPIHQWYHYPESWLMIFACIVISLLVAFTLQNNLELKLTKTNLETLSRKDFLTGIFNRLYFQELALMLAEKARREGKGYYIIMFDLDWFKMINDTHGHSAGDQVLLAVADKIKNMIRPYDLFARYGGEEFIIMMSDVEETSVFNIVERMRLGLEKTPINIPGKQLHVTASFGVAFASPIDDLKTAINHADIALYAAKNGGRNMTVLHREEQESYT